MTENLIENNIPLDIIENDLSIDLYGDVTDKDSLFYQGWQNALNISKSIKEPITGGDHDSNFWANFYSYKYKTKYYMAKAFWNIN